MALRSIRWGIIATGNIARCFAEDLALLPDHEIAAIGSRDRDRAEGFARTYGAGRAYGSYSEVADDPDVDVVYVATPHSDHYSTARYALEAGKAVLCEKTFTLDAAQARELVELARGEGRFLMEAMWMRTLPPHLKLLELVRSGTIGEPRAVQAGLGFVAEYDPDGRLFAPELGGGALLDVGIYPVALAHHVLGAPRTVRAQADLAPTGVDRTITIGLGYDNGAVASLTGSLAATLPNTATVAGTDGWIELPRSFHDTRRLIVHRPDGEPQEHRFDVTGIGLTYEAEETARCLRAGRTESELVPLDDTLAVMELMDEVRAQVGVRFPAVSQGN